MIFGKLDTIFALKLKTVPLTINPLFSFLSVSRLHRPKLDYLFIFIREFLPSDFTTDFSTKFTSGSSKFSLH